MVKKVTAPASEKQLTQTVKDSANQIWLAGLGAFSKTQEEGNKVFDALVKEGEAIQKKTREAADKKISGVREAADGRLAGVRKAVDAKVSAVTGKDSVAGFKLDYKGEIVEESYLPLNTLDFQVELSKIASPAPFRVSAYRPRRTSTS